MIMHNCINNLILIEKEIQSKNNKTKIIAVSKTYPIKDILPLINHGHKHFGENKVQEAMEKWSSIKNDFTNINLHLIGKLQTNKVKYVIGLFDYIHSLDNLKLAEKISTEQEKKKLRPKIFIQVNIGQEIQKNGIEPEQLEAFKNKCVKELKLNVIGLMCIPPADKDPILFFSEMNKLKAQLKLSELSMGMSADYIEAIKLNATYVRIGSKIFGNRS